MQKARRGARKAQEAETKALEDAMKELVMTETAAPPIQAPAALTNRQKKAAKRLSKKDKAKARRPSVFGTKEPSSMRAQVATVSIT